MTDVAGLGGGYGDSEPNAAPTVAAVLDAARPGDREAQLVVIAGPPGVGKSLLASGLCKTCGTTSIDKDWSAGGFILEASAQAGNGQDAAYDGPHYWQRLRPLEYAGAMTTACANLVGRRTVTLTGGWGPELAIDELWTGLQRRLAPTKLVVLHLDAPSVEIWRQRMAERGSRSDLPWFGKFAEVVTFHSVWPGAHRLASDGPPHAILQAAIAAIQTHP